MVRVRGGSNAAPSAPKVYARIKALPVGAAGGEDMLAAVKVSKGNLLAVNILVPLTISRVTLPSVVVRWAVACKIPLLSISRGVEEENPLKVTFPIETGTGAVVKLQV